MIHKLYEKIIRTSMVRFGYSPFFAVQVWNERWDDILHNHTTTWQQKIWSQRRGFLSDKIVIYGLTKNNYTDYLTDFDYKKIYPINGSCTHLIDDKLVIRYLLQPFRKYLPEYYFQIEKGQIITLPDLPAGFESSPDGIIRLLTTKGNLALKPVTGSKGIGFYKLSFDMIGFYINNLEVQREEIITLLNQLDKYLVTEYLMSHPDIRRVYAASPNTLRVLVIKPPRDDLIFANAHVRFGTSESGVVDNTSAGAIFADVDFETGRISAGRKYLKYGIESCEQHPDTGEPLNGTVPHLELIKSKIREISRYIPQIIYVGYDIIITDHSFKIIEMNSHPGIAAQHYYPLLKNENCRRIFHDLIEQQRRG